jgi:hypothetical protein
MANGASEIVARRNTCQHTASSDAANPIAGFSPWRGTAELRSSDRRTRGYTNLEGWNE